MKLSVKFTAMVGWIFNCSLLYTLF